MMLALFYLTIGVLFLFLGGEGLIRGSVTIADRSGLSKLLISTAVIGFGTSAPELVVSIEAAMRDLPEIAIGNVVGSNISNTLLILGLAAIFAAIPCHSPKIKLDALIGVAASLVMVGLSWVGFINRLAGLLMLIGLITYLTSTIWSEKRKPKRTRADKDTKEVISEMSPPGNGKALLIALGLCLISLVLIASGAHFLIKGAVSLAKQFGISDAVIGLSLVAIGTSLPELFIVAIASYRKHSDFIIGNILGSNLFNILSILGITAIITPIPFTGQIASQDVWVMLAISIILLLIISFRKKLTRIEGFIFLISYVLYIGWLYR